MLGRLATLCLTLSLAAACGGQPKAKKDESAKKAEAEGQAAKKEATPPAVEGASSSLPDGSPPSWFKAELLPGATVKKQSRSVQRDDGSYAGMMLFDLGEGSSEDCVKKVQAGLKAHVPDLKPTPSQTPDRLQLGGTDSSGFKITIVCGVNEGKATAYIGYNAIAP